MLIISIHPQTQTLFLSVFKCLISSIQVSFVSKNFYKIIFLKNKFFCSLVQNYDNPKIPKIADNSDVSAHSNSSLNVSTSPICFTKVSFGKTAFFQVGFVCIIFHFELSIRIVSVWKLQERCHQNWIISFLNFNFLRNYMFDLFHRRLKQIPCTCRTWSVWKKCSL